MTCTDGLTGPSNLSGTVLEPGHIPANRYISSFGTSTPRQVPIYLMSNTHQPIHPGQSANSITIHKLVIFLPASPSMLLANSESHINQATSEQKIAHMHVLPRVADGGQPRRFICKLYLQTLSCTSQSRGGLR